MAPSAAEDGIEDQPLASTDESIHASRPTSSLLEAQLLAERAANEALRRHIAALLKEIEAKNEARKAPVNFADLINASLQQFLAILRK